METKLLVTIDTEEDWQGPGEAPAPTTNNIYQIPRLQEAVFDKFGVRPVYLVSYVVAIDPRSIAVLKGIQSGGRCEIGAHLHHWNVPPYVENDVLKKSPQCSLPYAVERKKIEDLTNILQKNFEIRPVTFRAGRWAADGETIKILAGVGYKGGGRVTPLMDYTDEGGMDYYTMPFEPYFPSYRNILVKSEGDNSDLLEIPVTYGFSRKDFERLRIPYRILQNTPKSLHLVGLFYRLNILKRIKLSPENAHFSDMKRLVDICLERKHRVLHLTFHSSMCSLGNSPFSMVQKEMDTRMNDLRNILDYIVNVKNIKSCVAEDIYEEHKTR
jgi:hypothetical protein